MSKELIERLQAMLDKGHVRLDEIEVVEECRARIEALEAKIVDMEKYVADVSVKNGDLEAENARLARAWEAMQKAKSKAIASEKELFSELAALRAQKPVAWASILGEYAHIQWGKKPDDNIHTIPLSVHPVPSIPEGYVLVPKERLDRLIDGAKDVAYDEEGFTLKPDLAESIESMIAAAPGEKNGR